MDRAARLDRTDRRPARRTWSPPSSGSIPTAGPSCSGSSSPSRRRSSVARSSPTAAPSGWRWRTRPAWRTCWREPGSPSAPSVVMPIGDAIARWRDLDRGAGTVWAADASDGFHGGAALTRWVTDHAEAVAAAAELGAHGPTVRVMPFLEGIATSMHGIVLPDGVAVLRPGRAGDAARAATTACTQRVRHVLGPAERVRDEMRDAARRVGEQLRDEVDFRGAFTLDGVATADGFRPTELNPRFGAGLMVITRGLDGVPLTSCSTSSSAATDRRSRPPTWRRELLAEADRCRSGGTWQLHVPSPQRRRRAGRGLRRHVVALGRRRRGARRRLSSPASGSPASRWCRRARRSARASARGPSPSGASSTTRWAAGIGPLEAPPDVLRSSDRPPPSTRP